MDPPLDNALPWRARWRFALRERLPLWVQVRCGIEPGALAALVVVLVLAAAFAGYQYWTGRPQTVRAPAAEPVASRAEPAPSPGPPATPEADRRIVVDVTGKVRRPGIHRLPAGSRVADALTAAGGVRPGTDTRTLNRARLLIDGEQIVVGDAGPAGAANPAGTSGAGGTSGADSSGAAAGSSGITAGSSAAASSPISLNSATPEQLDALPGVGPVLAQHILDYRNQHGGFASVDQLREVNGIGDRRFADLRPLVRP